MPGNFAEPVAIGVGIEPADSGDRVIQAFGRWSGCGPAGSLGRFGIIGLGFQKSRVLSVGYGVAAYVEGIKIHSMLWGFPFRNALTRRAAHEEVTCRDKTGLRHESRLWFLRSRTEGVL